MSTPVRFPTKTMTAAALAAAIAAPTVMYFEGRENAAYLDIVAVPTICYGSTTGVRLGQTKTDAECDALLRGELGRMCEQVDKLVTVPMSATRHAALCSFTYNVGVGAFRRSTLLKKLNAGAGDAACAELSRWVHAGGKQVPGLVTRRSVERALCEWSATDAQVFEASSWVQQAVHVPLSATRQAALVAYAFNVGQSQLLASPVVAQLNAGAGAKACAALVSWPAPANQRELRQRQHLQRMCEVNL